MGLGHLGYHLLGYLDRRRSFHVGEYLMGSPPLLAYRFLLALSAASGVEAGQEIP